MQKIDFFRDNEILLMETVYLSGMLRQAIFFRLPMSLHT